MPNDFRNWSSHDSLGNISADFMNLLNEVCRDYLRRKGTKGGPVVVPPQTEVHLRNMLPDSHLAQYAVCSVGSPIVYPDENDSFFFGKAVFDAAPPAGGGKF